MCQGSDSLSSSLVTSDSGFPQGGFHKDFVLTLGRLGHRVKAYSEILRN